MVIPKTNISDIQSFRFNVLGFVNFNKSNLHNIAPVIRSLPVLHILLFCVFFLSLSVCYSQAQYKVTNSQKLFFAEVVDSIAKDEAKIVAENYFSFIAQKKRTEWNKLLSKDCFQEDGSPIEKMNRIWDKLSSQADRYEFSREVPAAKTNQKTFIFTSKQFYKKRTEKTLVLVKEHGKWKVFSMK